LTACSSKFVSLLINISLSMSLPTHTR
jgi:hypothetical protein